MRAYLGFYYFVEISPPDSAPCGCNATVVKLKEHVKAMYLSPCSKHSRLPAHIGNSKNILFLTPLGLTWAAYTYEYPKIKEGDLIEID